MKNQYFGDIRDLFKFDLSYQIYKSLNFESFVFIPMLTPDDTGSDGNKINFSLAKAGFYNKDLMFFLKYKLKNKERHAVAIADFFEYINIKTFVFEESFKVEIRKKYFDKALNYIKPNSLILIDPDNGIEVKNHNEKHILFSEINSVINIMDNQSILMIYQHFSRENHFKFISRKLKELLDITKISPLFISDNDILFFFLTKNPELFEKLNNTLVLYKKLYKKLFTDVESIKNMQEKIDFN